MPDHTTGPLETGGFFEEFSDGQGGTLRIEYRVDLPNSALEIWGGRPGNLQEIARLTA